MARELDDLDKRLVGMLQESAQQTNVDLADKLGVSEATVRRRINALVADEFVKIVAVADPLKIGYPVVAIIALRCQPSQLDEVERSLNQLDEFRFIGMTLGTYDFVAEAWFESLADLTVFITQRLSSVPGIQRIETAHVMKMVRYQYDWGRASKAVLPSR